MGTIDGVGGATPARSGWAPRGPAGDGFVVPNGPGVPARPVTAGAPNGVLMETMLTLQAAALPDERRREALRKGHELLRLLGRLQTALLGGDGGEMELEALVTLCHQIEMPPEPALAAVLGAIRLRAQVELARFGH